VTEVAVIGGGVVGVAVAAALGRQGHDVTVLEKNAKLGQEVSARNSGVIHAGIYYPADSIKAQTCVEGRERLYARCVKAGVPHRETGKLIVATDEEGESKLEELRRQGMTNGAGALEILDAAKVHEKESRVRARAALWSPRTGIVDVHMLVRSLAGEAENFGASIALCTTVSDIERLPNGWRLHTVSDGEPFALDVPVVVNAAGLGAEGIAAAAGVDIDRARWRLHLCKGDYFSVSGLGLLTRHLVYPVPGVLGLGTHITFDLGGQFRLGPDAEYVPRVSFNIDEAKAEGFAAAVSQFLPEVTVTNLSPDFAGIRPKLQAPGEAFRDFVIEEGTPHGTPGMIHLIGIESPGLTASLAIGERVARMVNSLR